MPEQDFWMVCLHAVPLHWHQPRPSCFPTGSSRAKVQQPRPASSRCTQPCRPLLQVQLSPSARLEIPPVFTHRHVPRCRIATRNSQFPVQHCVGFVPFPSWPSNACMALQQEGMWWKQCLLFSRFPQKNVFCHAWPSAPVCVPQDKLLHSSLSRAWPSQGLHKHLLNVAHGRERSRSPLVSLDAMATHT